MKPDWRRNIALALASLLAALPGALSATEAELRLSAPTCTNGQIQFTLNCQSGVAYVIERSPDLQSWTPVLTNNGSSTTRVLTATAPGVMGFYRARRGPPVFGAALAVQQTFNSNGNNVTTDSFDSSQGPYNPATASTNGDMVSLTANANSLVIGNGRILGTVRTPPSGVQGVTATIGAYGSVGDAAWVNGGNMGFQPGHFKADFTMTNFPNAVLPNVTPWFSPSPGMAPDGTNYNYLLAGLHFLTANLTGSVYVGQTNAVLYVTGSINISGGGIHIAPGASLTIYMAGATTTIAGNGLVNDTLQAKSFAYYGLPANTTINITGNGAFYGTIYAPQADFHLGSGGSSADDFTGAAITKTTTLSGHFNFHYDENLARTGPFR